MCIANKRTDSLKRVSIALSLVFFYMLVELIGGYLSNSLALVADAFHMLTDLAALGLTLVAFWFASRPKTPEKTYGYYRLEILAAFINGVFLVSLSFFIIYEAYKRWQKDVLVVDGESLTLIAIGGLIVNLICVYLLHDSADGNLNLRGAWLHAASDALGSISAILAGLLIMLFDWTWADAAMSLFISLIIIYGSWQLIKDSVNVLLEGTPSHINLKALERTIRETKSVKDVHDLHVWTITSGIHALSVHVVYEDGISQQELLRRVKSRINKEFGIDHLTIQMEKEGDPDNACICTFEVGSVSSRGTGA